MVSVAHWYDQVTYFRWAYTMPQREYDLARHASPAAIKSTFICEMYLNCIANIMIYQY